jgi:twitching motility protein PilT
MALPEGEFSQAQPLPPDILVPAPPALGDGQPFSPILPVFGGLPQAKFATNDLGSPKASESSPIRPAPEDPGAISFGAVASQKDESAFVPPEVPSRVAVAVPPQPASLQVGLPIPPQAAELGLVDAFERPNSKAMAPFKEPSRIVFGPNVPGVTIDPNVRSPIDQLLREMIKRSASDLHLTVGERVAFRVDGDIVRHDSVVMTEDFMEKCLVPIMPPLNYDEFTKSNDTDFAYSIEGVARFRVNMFRDRHGVGAVLRLIPSAIPTADQLGLPPVVRSLCQLSKGLVVVTGPTGSGKSTTLAAMIDLINSTRHEHIISIEDPVEFSHPQKRCLIHQREVFRHTQSFSRALKAALREDPDIVLVGEMRDPETVGIAIETAETGHLVFGTLHTNTAISTVDRIIDQFPSAEQAQIRTMLAESLKGVVAQTLCKKKSGGRVAALEILVVNHAVSSLIREGKTFMIASVMQTQKSEGNILLNEALLNLVQKGQVEPKTAYFKAVDRDGFAKMLQAKGISLDLEAS